MNQFEINKKMPHFTIYGRLGTYNDYIHECRNSPFDGAKMKNRDEALVMWNMGDIVEYHFDKVILHFRFFEANRKRDKDNIFAYAAKIVLDAMVELKIIDNDGWKQVENFTHDFFVDADSPRIEVYIEEVGKGRHGC